MNKENLKLQLQCWYKYFQIFWKDVIMLKLRFQYDYKLFQIENRKNDLRNSGFTEEAINNLDFSDRPSYLEC